MIGLPYANTNCFGAAITFNKWACNSFLRAFGISTAKAILIRKNDKFNPIEIADEIGFPCFVKPNGAGSSFGITKVKTLMQMPEAIAKAFEEDDEVVVEALLTGREITCGVYRVGNKVYPLPPTEIIAEGEFFDYEAKYEGKSQEITPAEIGDAAIEKIQNTAKSIFRRLDLKGFARIDFMFSEDGVPNLIEVNTNPGMSEASLIPQQIRVAGLDLKTVLTEILGAVEI